MCLALGRSFRVGWGPSGEIAHLGGGLYEAAGSGAKADEVKVDKLRMLAVRVFFARSPSLRVRG